MFFSEKKIKKLSSLGRVKKAALIIQEVQQELCLGKSIDSSYLKNFLGIVEKDLNVEWKELFFSSLSKIPEKLTNENFRDLSNLRYVLLANIGKEPADWCMDMDCQVRYSPYENAALLSPGGGELSPHGVRRENSALSSPDGAKRKEREVLPINVYLDDLRSPFNVGSIFRTAESFCYENIFLSPYTPSPDHKRAGRSSMGTVELVKWSRATVDALPMPVFALETGGTPVEDFDFPKSGTVIIGSEEDGISSAAIDIAGKSLGVVSIPLYGIKGSLNVGVAFGILSYYWINKLKAGKNF